MTSRERVLAALNTMDIREQTIICITSDHGDEFMEHGGLGHGTSVYGELVRVPLVISYPRALKGGRRVRHMSQHMDLGPTLLHLAGVQKPPSFRGGTLFDAADLIFTEDAAYRAASARLRRYARADEETFRKRLGDFLARRGFSYGIVRNVLDRLWEEQTMQHDMSEQDFFDGVDMD